MKNKTGFTLVELIVVIAILGLLTVIAVFNYLNVQRQARDEQRATDATVVAESLERYFAKNGEYPSVSQMTNSDGNAVRQLLGLGSIDSLLAPLATSGATNSWQTGTASISNQLTYKCKSTTPPATTPCEDFTIQYFSEQESTLVAIDSRNKTASIDVIQREGIVAPDAPSVSVAASGSNALATATPVACQTGTTPRYSFQSQVNNSGTWSAWGAWTTGTTSSLAATEGSKYDFRVKAQCQTGSTVSADSATSNTASYIRQLSTPSAPAPYITASIRPNYNGGLCMDAAGQGGAGTAIQVYTCNGTAAQDWAYNSNDRTIRPTYNMSLCISHEGGGVQFRLRACDGNAVRQWNSDTRGYFVSVSSGHCMDAVNWGGSGTPIAAGNCNNASAQIWNPSDSQTAWTWPHTTCPAGATREYQVYRQTTGLADSGWVAPTDNANARDVRTTSSQGHTYTNQVRVRCTSPFDQSDWSGSGVASVNKAVFRPGNPYNWAFGVWGGRNGWGWSFASPACGAGTAKTYQEESWIGVNNNSGGSLMYWLSPRTPSGPGNVWWYTANSTGGANYIWYAPDGSDRGTTFVDHPSGGVPSGVDVTARAMYRCRNNITGREAYGDWYQTVMNYT